MSKVMEEVHLTTIKPKNNVLLLAQEISFAKVLACNDKRLRDRGVRRLKKWFMARSQGTMDFTRDDHMRIWKGLFYCMWMSDKPLIQEDLAEEISNLIHSFASFKSSLLFVETFFASLSVEWFGIDQLRLDKYMMLVRRFLRQSLQLVSRLGWREENVQQLADVYQKSLSSSPLGLSMHIIEVFCEELAKVGKGELSSKTILQFVTLFACLLATLKDGRLISQITRFVFLHLIRQTELGIEHQEKYSAWKEYGFPGGNLDAAEKVEVESDSDEEEVEQESEDDEEEDWKEERKVGVDARAGKVDVLLPPLDFEPSDLLEVLRELRNKRETTTKARKTLIQLISKFENLAAGKYPLGLHKVELPNKVDKKKLITQAAKKLYFDEQRMIHSDSDAKNDGGDKKSLKNKDKKLKAIKQKKSVWEVSESSKSEERAQSGCNESWEIKETSSKVSPKQRNSKKRKLSDEERSDDGCLKNKAKKTNSSSFCDHVSKENSSLPVTSTPKTQNTNSSLRNLTNQNLPAKENQLTPKVSSGKKNRKNKLELNKSKISKNEKRTKSKSLETLSNNDSTALLSGDENQNSGTNEKETETEIQLNASTTDKNNGWGGEWDEPLQEGEYEIFIPNKKYVEKRKSLGLPFPVSSFVQKSAEKVTPVNRLKNESKNQLSTPRSQKKVEFNLSANCSQEYKEYSQKVKRSKSQVPFDATKKPVQGLLKNSTPSPINPFYKKKLKFLSSPKNV